MPYCVKCGKEIPAEAAFCPYCGAPVREAPIGRIPSGYTIAELGERIVAGLIDYVILLIVAAILFFIVAVPFFALRWAFGMWELAFGGFWPFFGLSWIIWLVYFTYFEGTSGQTFGKRVSNIRVVKENGEPCDMGSAFIRSLLRIIDRLPFLYILGIIIIAVTPKRQRIGDLLAKTIVVKTR